MFFCVFLCSNAVVVTSSDRQASESNTSITDAMDKAGKAGIDFLRALGDIFCREETAAPAWFRKPENSGEQPYCAITACMASAASSLFS